MNVVALVLSFLCPFVVGTWIFLRAGQSVLAALSRGLWMTIYAVLPVMAWGIVAAGMKQIAGFNVFPAVPLVVLVFFVWVSRLRSPTPQKGQSAEVITYKPGAYCQLKLPSGERVLISFAKTGIRISKLVFGGIIPSETIVEWPISQISCAIDTFADESTATLHPLDAVKNKLLSCPSISDIERLCARSPGSDTARDAALRKAQELVNRYGAVLEESKTLTRSEADLPATKEEIKDALVALARHAKNSGSSAERLEPLRSGYASLADFASKGDAEAANEFDNLTAADTAQLDDRRIRALARKIGESGTGALDVTRRSTDEVARLTAEFDERVSA